MTTSDIDARFSTPNLASTDRLERVERVTDAVRDAARVFDEVLESSRETSLAITKLEEALMWAEKSARHHGPASSRQERVERKASKEREAAHAREVEGNCLAEVPGEGVRRTCDVLFPKNVQVNYDKAMYVAARDVSEQALKRIQSLGVI